MALWLVLLTFLAAVFTVFPLVLEVGMYCGLGEGDQEGTVCVIHRRHGEGDWMVLCYSTRDEHKGLGLLWDQREDSLLFLILLFISLNFPVY